MKKFSVTIINLLVVVTLSAQTGPSVNQSEGMVFVPQGSFQRNIIRNSVTILGQVTVKAFWMSNEITNSEFRVFVDWIKKNPTEKLNQVKYVTKVFSDPNKGRMCDSTIKEVIPIEVLKINDQFDQLCLEKLDPDYEGYFSNNKYNDYPVVGLSYNMAEYYCIWKTMMENEQRKEKGLSEIQPYRLPSDQEWEYAAQMKNEDSKGTSTTIQKVNEGSHNELGLYHLDDNVSEWIGSNFASNQVLARGGSWSSEKSKSVRIIKDNNSKDASIGFRIVQSDVTEKKITLR